MGLYHYVVYKTLLKPEDIEKAMALMKEIIEKGSAKPIEMMSGTKDGREFPCSFTASLIKDAEGNPQNLVAVIRDITELKRAEEKRIEAEKKAARAEEAEKYSRDLEAKVKELEEFHDLAVGRELKMKKMEEELEELKKKLEKIER